MRKLRLECSPWPYTALVTCVRRFPAECEVEVPFLLCSPWRTGRQPFLNNGHLELLVASELILALNLHPKDLAEMRIGTISKPQASSLLSPTFRRVAITQDREGTRGGDMGAGGRCTLA